MEAATWKKSIGEMKKKEGSSGRIRETFASKEERWVG